tara:strand:+ start:1401 stop:1706 length:306 start_codon:yes stop_codon:yes gene_type:complete
MRVLRVFPRRTKATPEALTLRADLGDTVSMSVRPDRLKPCSCGRSDLFMDCAPPDGEIGSSAFWVYCGGCHESGQAGRSIVEVAALWERFGPVPDLDISAV